MKIELLLLGALLTTTVHAEGVEDDTHTFAFPFSESGGWHLLVDEPWWVLFDMRDMLNLFHPLVVPQTGSVAGASREVVLPSDWEPPFALRFFCADDYFADAEKHKPGQLGTESFFEHRFKQVLIGDQVIWERDVCDENVQGSQVSFQLDITPYVTPGKPFQLTFRVLDRVTTLERNERDVWFIGGTWYTPGDGETEEPPRFHTAVWFADPVIGETQAVEAAPAGQRPHEQRVAERHQERWPLPPRGQQMAKLARFQLVTPASVPEPGFPVSCGIPVPPGMLHDETLARLHGANGEELPVQAETTGVWPDGSTRWLLLNTILRAGASSGTEYHLSLNDGRGVQPAQVVQIRREDRGILVDTGALRMVMGGDPQALVDEVWLDGTSQSVMRALRPQLSVLLDGQSTPVLATCQQPEVKCEGPLVACIETTGTLDLPHQHIARFLFRVYAYAGLPTVQTQFRIINSVKPEPYHGTKEDAPLDITNLALVATITDGIQNCSAGIAASDVVISKSGTLSVFQEDAERIRAVAGGEAQVRDGRAEGWLSVSGPHGTVQASVWRFWQQAPKSLIANSDQLLIGLFTPSETEPLYQPRFGEAKRHDVWFSFADEPTDSETQRALGRLADEPPRLFDGDWFCRSGGIAVMDPDFYEQEIQLRDYVTTNYGDVSTERVTRHFGIRNFGDMPYGSDGQWRNGYWATVQGSLNWGLALGDQRWLERSFEIARHIADVDTSHIPTGHPDWHEWHGVICALGNDHSVHGGHAKWPAFQLGESLILHYWMTGDLDSFDAAVANADYLIRSKAGLGSSEARSQARPMLTLLRVWQATGDPVYLEAANQYLDLGFQTEKVLDWRRGAYIQPTYENWRCISAGLDSMYALNIYDYYRLTGNLDAAQLVVAIADSVYAESMLPQEEGLGSFLFYVRYSRSAWYYTQMAMLFHAAYDLTEDARFLRAGRAAFERYRLCQQPDGSPMYQPYDNFGWLDPEFGGWQMELRHIPTEPFHITKQTPIPDPSGY